MDLLGEGVPEAIKHSFNSSSSQSDLLWPPKE